MEELKNNIKNPKFSFNVVGSYAVTLDYVLG